MSISLIGINHKTAPVAIREQVAFSPARLQEALVAMNDLSEEGLILSTCNRTEVYVVSHATQNIDDVIYWLAEFHGLRKEQLEQYIYKYEDDSVVRHLLRVACGLDSLVLGEPQILGQLKDALKSATDQGSVGNQLNRLTQHVFSAAKKVRTQTEIGSNPISVAYAAVSLSKQIFSDLGEQTALLVGAGETIELVGRHLKKNRIKHIIVANRSVDKAEKLAEEYEGKAISLAEIPHYLPQADIVISSTAAPMPIIGKGMVESALKARKHQPIFMVDIAVPRDIEEEVGHLDDVYLYTVDDLQEVIQENMKSRRQAAEQAELMLDTEVHTFMGWLQAQSRMSQIRAYRSQIQKVKQEVLDKTQRRLKNGESVEDAMQYLAHTLTNKLAHAPSRTMNQAAHQGDNELLDAARKLLNIQDSM